MPTVDLSTLSVSARTTLAAERDGYYPLYGTEALAQSVSSAGTAHSHDLRGQTWWMPDGGIQGGGQFHGDYTGDAVATEPSGYMTAPAGSNSYDVNKFKFRSMGLSHHTGWNQTATDNIPIYAGVTNITEQLVINHTQSSHWYAAGSSWIKRYFSGMYGDFESHSSQPAALQWSVVHEEVAEANTQQHDYGPTRAGVHNQNNTHNFSSLNLNDKANWTYGIPPGMTFDADRGMVTGTPTTPGMYYMMIAKQYFNLPSADINYPGAGFVIFVEGQPAGDAIAAVTVDGGGAAYDAATSSSITTISDSTDDTATKVTNILAVLIADATWTANTANYSAKTAAAKTALYSAARSSIKVLVDIRAGTGAAVQIPVADLKALRPDLPAEFAPTTVGVAENGSTITVDADAGGGFTAPLEDGETTTVTITGGGQSAVLVISMSGGLYTIADTEVSADDLLEDDGSGGKQTKTGGVAFSALGDSFAYKGFNIYYGASGSAGGGSSGGDPFIATML